MCYLSEEVLINTVNNQTMTLHINPSLLEEEYEELSQEELVDYLRDLAHKVRARS
jgi:DNA-binding transcriptional regulator YhcF (GntR family)